ncbi:putative F-box protein At1g65770 [Argentina anserina]|uniref:putative F-box protein At1g65770 n=1 Tax=Argentina anserina TaxID=57926 RepID=UPI0021762229|nr:putative F-box protein At1g65770 [Potentilla anserina]XP_050368306.1 putative F-box protein At1g65770 [Potentilla anserina]XP_050368314.1 putative F-box protein At1g65770 [Potentilla anserina]XP_050368322.1 putative F-box protein At1g65770 [Potentilla anserina]
MDIIVDWSNLPIELWTLIGEKLKLHIEYLRFRSVCHSWRSNLPPFHPSPPPKFPLPLSSSNEPTSFLCQNTLYLLRSPATSSSGGWFLKVEESDMMLLRNPITSRRIRYSRDESLSECLNLLEFKMVELGKSYFLRYIRASGSVSGLKKVTLMPSEKGSCVIVIIDDQGKLGFAKSGDQKVRWFSHGDCVFDDVVVYKGQTYVVDGLGCVVKISLCSETIQISSKLDGSGGRKHLVECGGELYVVDRYFDEAQNKQEGLDWGMFRRRRRYRRYESGELKVVDFKVYKLEWGEGELGRWVEVKSLVDQAIFLANDCSFSVSAKELAGCEGNCIYFTDENNVNLALRDVTRPENFVFSLEDRSTHKLGSSPDDSTVFWPPTK